MTDLHTARERFRRHMNGTSRDLCDWKPFGVNDDDFGNAEANGQGVTKIVNVKLGKDRKAKGKPGRGLINTATVLLFLLIGALFIISWWAQYKYVFDVKHQSIPSMIEASTLDAGQLIFSLLAIGLARAGMSARWARTGVIVCAAMSALMNYFPSNSTSWGSVAAYVFPPLFLAYVVDTVVIVIRRHVLGETADSSWKAAASAASRSFKFGGLFTLYCIRLVLAPAPTVRGMRAWVLNVTPLPEVVPVITDARKPIIPPKDRKALPPPKGPRGPRANSKTARFIARVEERHGPLSRLCPWTQSARSPGNCTGT